MIDNNFVFEESTKGDLLKARPLRKLYEGGKYTEALAEIFHTLGFIIDVDLQTDRTKEGVAIKVDSSCFCLNADGQKKPINFIIKQNKDEPILQTKERGLKVLAFMLIYPEEFSEKMLNDKGKNLVVCRRLRRKKLTKEHKPTNEVRQVFIPHNTAAGQERHKKPEQISAQNNTSPEDGAPKKVKKGRPAFVWNRPKSP